MYDWADIERYYSGSWWMFDGKPVEVVSVVAEESPSGRHPASVALMTATNDVINRVFRTSQEFIDTVVPPRIEYGYRGSIGKWAHVTRAAQRTTVRGLHPDYLVIHDMSPGSPWLQPGRVREKMESLMLPAEYLAAQEALVAQRDMGYAALSPLFAVRAGGALHFDRTKVGTIKDARTVGLYAFAAELQGLLEEVIPGCRVINENAPVLLRPRPVQAAMGYIQSWSMAAGRVIDGEPTNNITINYIGHGGYSILLPANPVRRRHLSLKQLLFSIDKEYDFALYALYATLSAVQNVRTGLWRRRVREHLHPVLAQLMDLPSQVLQGRACMHRARLFAAGTALAVDRRMGIEHDDAPNEDALWSAWVVEALAEPTHLPFITTIFPWHMHDFFDRVVGNILACVNDREHASDVMARFLNDVFVRPYNEVPFDEHERGYMGGWTEVFSRWAEERSYAINAQPLATRTLLLGPQANPQVVAFGRGAFTTLPAAMRAHMGERDVERTLVPGAGYSAAFAFDETVMGRPFIGLAADFEPYVQNARRFAEVAHGDLMDEDEIDEYDAPA